LILFIWACSGSDSDLKTLERGKFRATLTESGELHAVNSKIINMPDFSWQYGKTKIVDMKTEGIIVKKGTYIAQVDTSNVVRNLVQTKADLEIAEADFQKLLIEHVSARRQLESELNAAEAALRLAEIDTLSVQFETVAKKEQSKIEHEMCLLEVNKLRSKIFYQSQIHQEEKFILEEKIKNHKRAIRNARDTINRFTLFAPADGMIEYLRRGRPRRKISVGDEFYPGDPIIGLPDLSKMKAATTVNERDVKKVSLGQSVSIRLDAFPQKAFIGKVVFISKMCHPQDEDSQIKVFDVEILLDETDIILKPGMTINCEILVTELEDVFSVRTEHIHEEAEGYCIYIEREGARVRIPVRLGPRNSKAIVVYGDLKESDTLMSAPDLEKEHEI
jgi:RND family efflux transporter MFP subunit